jgi:hypothetical protein
MPGSTLVPLWPLAAMLLLVALFAAYMLYRARANSLSNEGAAS